MVGPVWLVLDDVVHFLIEVKIIGMDGVELLARDIDDFHRRRVAGLRQGIDLGELPGVSDRGRGAAIVEEAAPEEEISVGRRPQHKIAFGNLAFIAWWQKQVLSTLALVRTGIADIADVFEPVVVDHAQDVGRRLDDQRTSLRVQPHQIVDALGVSGKEQRM